MYDIKWNTKFNIKGTTSTNLWNETDSVTKCLKDNCILLQESCNGLQSLGIQPSFSTESDGWISLIGSVIPKVEPRLQGFKLKEIFLKI